MTPQQMFQQIRTSGEMVKKNVNAFPISQDMKNGVRVNPLRNL